jgi:hypothetical protein
MENTYISLYIYIYIYIYTHTHTHTHTHKCWLSSPVRQKFYSPHISSTKETVMNNYWRWMSSDLQCRVVWWIALIMEAASTSKTSVNFHQTIRHCNPEDSNLHTRRSENHKSCLWTIIVGKQLFKTDLWNVCKFLRDYTAQQLRRLVIFILAAVRTWNHTSKNKFVHGCKAVLFL